MASVVISGDTSGAATISAPAVAGTPTLTLPTTTDTLVGKATTDTLTNKTLTTPVISTISNTGTLTLPTSTDTLVGRATTDTLTNKTLTSPTIATPTMTGQATIPTINLTGGQITFPATASPSSNANTLDDYEEGTWTPTLNGITSVAYSQQYGNYLKIGRQVTVTARFFVSSGTGSGASFEVDSLPFQASSAAGGGNGFTSITYKTLTGLTGSYIAHIYDGQSNIGIFNASGASSAGIITLSGAQSGYFVMGATYFI